MYLRISTDWHCQVRYGGAPSNIIFSAAQGEYNDESPFNDRTRRRRSLTSLRQGCYGCGTSSMGAAALQAAIGKIERLHLTFAAHS
nr:hypothetical protein CFP56_31517 [Quercus suber]